MAITPVSIGTNTSTSTATVAVTVPAGGVPGGVGIIVCVAEGSATPGGSVTDTAGNTYTSISSVQVSSGAAFGALFLAINVNALNSGDSITFTKQTSGDVVAISCLYAAGIDRASPGDSGAANNGNGTSPSITSGVPSVTGELMVTCLAVLGPSTDTFTQDGAFTSIPVRASATTVYVAGGYVVTGALAVTYAPTITSNKYALLSYLLKPGAPTLGSQAVLIL